jgi:lipoprotein-anchoring transpeptidase ErfK/SrfK
MPASSDPSKTEHRRVNFRPQLLTLCALTLLALVIARETIPFEIRIPEALLTNQSVDPSLAIQIRGTGLGTRLTDVRLLKEDGSLVLQSRDKTVDFPVGTLEFGAHYTLIVQAERAWLHQSDQQEVHFRTPILPRIESPLAQQLDGESRLQLSFSEKIGTLKTQSDIPFDVQMDAERQHVTLSVQPGNYEQGRHYPVVIHWETPEGIILPAFEVDVLTAPPLQAEIDLRGMKNLGLAMPVEITFNEPVQDREKAASSVHVETETGETIPGKWLWYGKQRLQYRPETLWPAHQTLEVRIQPGPARSLQGGFLAAPVSAKFSTGSDRRIEVWLDRQRVEIFENGALIKTLKASTGKSKTPTVTGNFYIYARFPKKTMKSTGLKPGEKGYYEVKDVPYAQYFHEGYAFHGAFWHNAFGQPASHGCINLATQEKNTRQGINEDAGWLYQWASLGVPVIVHETSPAKTSAH